MNTTRAMLAVERAKRRAPFDVVFKAAAGVGFASLAAFGTATSFFTHTPSLAVGAFVALVGAMVGAFLVVKA